MQPVGELVNEIRLGRWQDVLTDVECDAWISDPPYGRRTHEGHDDAATGINQAAGARELGYSWLEPADVHEIVEHWSPRTRGWFAAMTSHDLIPHWEAALDAAGRYAFAPIPIIGRYIPRMCGDGPGSGIVWMIVARPRSAAFIARGWGSMPNRYEQPPGEGRSSKRRMGGKSLGMLRAIVRDYSRPGEVVCDPFAGNGTGPRAAQEEGREAVGSEVDPEAWEIARDWLAEPVSGALFRGGEGRDRGKPGELDLG